MCKKKSALIAVLEIKAVHWCVLFTYVLGSCCDQPGGFIVGNKKKNPYYLIPLNSNKHASDNSTG